MKYRIILAASVLMALAGCRDNDDIAPAETAETAEQPTTPTQDALTVKYDGSYVVYGELEHDFDLALQRRLQGSMASPMDADCFIFDMAALNQSSLSLDEWKEMVRRCQSGKASYVITQCSFKDFYDFAVLYILSVMAIELENYQGDTDPDAQAEAKARAKQRMANVVRNAYIASGQADGAMTRGTEVNDQELDWENIDQWPQEKQNAIMFDAYAFCGGNEIYVLNAEASKYMNGEEEEADQPDNDYEWGQKADAIADWLNRQGKDDAETRSGLSDFRHAVTRAEGSIPINDLMAAQTKEFVFDYRYDNQWIWNEISTAYSAIKVRYTAYDAYNFGDNVEYYQVRQNIIVMNDLIFSEGGSNYAPGWFDRPDIFTRQYGKKTYGRGAWMKSIDTKMWLEGSGTKSVVSASPLNENGSSSGSSTTGGATATTEGWSVSHGFSLGGSIDSHKTLLGSLSYNFAHTKEHSTTNEISWNTTTNWSTKDLTTAFTQGNDANATVTWKHLGNTPTTVDGAKTNAIKPLLNHTCITDEQTLWKIENPSGTYTLKANFNVTSELMEITPEWVNHPITFTTPNPYDISFELNAPNRYKAKWNNYVINYGSVQGDPILTGALDDYLEKTYGVSSGNSCWASLFISTEATADGSDNARAVFQTFKNSIRGLKQTMRNKGYGGTLVFGLKRDTEDEDKPIDKLTLDLNATYNEGETLTEQVNGYDLTFKVTKKNVEVELSSVPNNFQGELVIPANIQYNALTVTSLGNNSAVRRQGITSVTIPSTIKTIQNGALAELNITKIIVPEGVTDISTWAFHADKEVTKVYLPSTLKSIDYCAFMNMDKLAEVHIKATTPPALDHHIFYPRYDDAVLYVPKGYKQYYANAVEWNCFKNIVEE